MFKTKVVVFSFLIGLSVFISLLISYWIGEKYFFDELFYKKSIVHGYSHDEWNVAARFNIPSILEKRVEDVVRVRDLYYANDNSKVLGSSDPDQNEEFVVVLIGDSFVYGMGIREEQRFGKLLEKKLNSIYPTKVYILAQSGDGIIENYAKFNLANKYLKPNLYILGLVNNDLVFELRDKYPSQKDLYTEVKQFCPGEDFVWFWLLESFKEESWQDVIINLYATSFLPKYQNVCLLEKIAENIVKTSNKTMFYSFYQENNKVDNLDDELNQLHARFMKKYIDAIERAGGTVVFQPDEYFWPSVSNTERHPSAQANEDFANQLFTEITKNQFWGFPPTN